MNKTLEKDMLKMFIEIKDFCNASECNECRFHTKGCCDIRDTFAHLSYQTFPKNWELNEIRKDLTRK